MREQERKTRRNEATKEEKMDTFVWKEMGQMKKMNIIVILKFLPLFLAAKRR